MNGTLHFDYQEAFNLAIKALKSIETDWKEMLVICDNCGHAITVKRGVE